MRAVVDATDVTDAVSAFPVWQLYVGFFAGLAPFIIAAYEFGKRVRIQRLCARCAGSGLIDVERKKGGTRKVKCTSCGGFLPWESWERFLSSDPGNGGVLRAPKGQTRALYDVEASVEASRRAAAERTPRRNDDGEPDDDDDDDDDDAGDET